MPLATVTTGSYPDVMLLVAAGGGGDVITASVLAPVLGLGTTAPVLTYSWDRLVIDPVPGPRTVTDFDGLDQIGPKVFEVLPTSVPRLPAGSGLPRLAAEVPARLLFLDPSGGAVGMAGQIKAASEVFSSPRVGLVDVGGDILAHGGEPGLRSPLADLLALAACTSTGLACQLLVVAPGIDGELDERTVLNCLAELNADKVATLDSRTFDSVRRVFSWHPSEASGLVAAAADGHRGSVETRDAASRVQLTDDTAVVFGLDAYVVAESSPATLLRSTRSFDEAAQVVSDATGVAEVAYEADKASRLRSRVPGTQLSLPELATIDRQVAAAADRGVGYITIRRLAELVGVTTSEALTAFQALLAAERAEAYQPPLYRVTGAPRPG